MASPSSFLFFPQLRGELWKLFTRKRTYIGFGAYLLVELLIILLMQLPKVKRGFQRVIEQQGGLADQYYSGLSLAFIVVSLTVFILGPLFLALVSGDIVAKEVEDGTMRMILSRPVSRFRVVWVRYITVLIYTGVLFTFVALSALLVGVARQGSGGLFIFAPLEKILAFYEFTPGLHRYLLSIPLLALSFTAVSSLGFLFSCCNMKPSAATILCLSLYFIDMIFYRFPQFASIHEWILTTHMLTWMNVFRPQIPTLLMVEDYAFLLGANGTFFVVGWLIFQSRDFKA